MVGQTIGKYRVVEQIGRGGMGTVYKAIDETLNRRVAIKVLNADLIDQEAVERFRREAMTLARLNHGRIGAIHELTREGHDLIMVMEYLDGETVEKLIERGPMAVPRAVSLVSQVLDALEYAHGAGVIHRDLKPANLMLSPSGDVKVMDFGIARVQGSEHLTTNGYMVGTPAYMAPEQVRGEEVDPRMDLYSVAVVLYRMLTHHLPFHGDTAIAMIHSQLNNPPTPPQQFRADLPEWLVGALERGLSKKPGDRFQTAREFRAALEKGLTGKMPIVKTGTAPIPTSTGSMRAPSTVSTPAPSSGSMPAPPATRNIPGTTGTEKVPQSTSPAAAAATGAGVVPHATQAGPQPAASSPGAGGATVTLRSGHLATAGLFVLVLVIGGVVLAFIALRRPTTVIMPAQSASTQSAPQAGATAAGSATTTPSPEPAAAPAPAEPTPAAIAPPPSTAAASSAPGRGTTSPSTTPTSPAASAAPKPLPATPLGAARGGSPATGTAAANAGRGTATTTPTPAAAAPPPAPAAALAPAQNFGDVKTVIVEGSKSREVDALLSLEPGNLIVRSKSDGAVLRSVPYNSIAAATYARGRRPRGQAAPGLSNIPDDVGGGLFGGARHWLTLQMGSEYVIIRLEDRNVIAVLNGLETRTGNKITRTQGN